MSLARALDTSTKPITLRHIAWLQAPTPYSADALDFAQWALKGQMPPRKRRLLRASGFGTCMRARTLTWLRLPESNRATWTLQTHFDNGSFAHLRWQMAGLTEGWLVEPEPDFPDYDTLVGARSDGILHTGHLWEFKTARKDVYMRIRATGRPLWPHLGQVGYAMRNSGIERAVLLYENKEDPADWTEIVIDGLPDRVADAIDREVQLWRTTHDTRTLPPMLRECQESPAARTSKHRCPFADVCPSAESAVEELWDAADQVKEDA